VKSLLYQRGAWTYAMAGDAERTAKALDNAQKALTATDGEEGPAWARWAHNSTEWRIMAGRCWAELHKPLRAVPILETAMSEYDDSRARDKALYLSWLADAYLDAGELEHAVSVTGHSLDLADGVASVRPRERLGAVLSRLEGHESAAGVKDLLARRPVNPVKVRR
jgi:tetratricopeptide (TPR) repeat protein